jgi:hypothetical protein
VVYGRQRQPAAPDGIGGWLLTLCVLLVAWQPLSLAFVASRMLDALPVRGPVLAIVLVARVLVASVGIAAGLALLGRRPGALRLARTSLVLSAATDTFIYTTPYFPSNRVPGDSAFFVAGSLAYSAMWLAYLFRSRRVRNTYG